MRVGQEEEEEEEGEEEEEEEVIVVIVSFSSCIRSTGRARIAVIGGKEWERANVRTVGLFVPVCELKIRY